MSNVYKLTLLGHVHGNPNHKETSYYAWPKGVSVIEAQAYIESFSKAFTLLEATLYGRSE